MESVILRIVACGSKIFIFVTIFCLKNLLEALKAVLETLSYALPRFSRKLFNDTGGLSSGFLLAMLEALESIRALVSRYNSEAFFHLQVNRIDIENATSDSGIKDKEFFFQYRRALLYSMPDNFFYPHFNSFPSSEPGEEVEFFNLFVNLFLF